MPEDFENIPYAVCEEIIDEEPSGIFTVRWYTDTNPLRFWVHQYFATYEEADSYINELRNNE